MSGYVLHGAVRSSAAWRARLALNIKGVDYREIYYDLQAGAHNSPAYRAINPQGLVPALQCPDGRVLFQSLAIIEYLDEVESGPRLMPSTPAARARVRALSLIVAADIHPVNNMRIRNHVRDLLPDDPDAVARWMNKWSKAGFDALEAQLQDGETGRFSHGDNVTMADLCLVPQVFNARAGGRDLSPWPTIVRIAAACEALPVFATAHPDRQRPA